MRVNIQIINEFIRIRKQTNKKQHIYHTVVVPLTVPSFHVPAIVFDSELRLITATHGNGKGNTLLSAALSTESLKD